MPIRRAYAEAYALLSEPRNFPKWSPVADALFEPLDSGGLRYRVDLPRGRRIIAFTPRNAHGILDYVIETEEGRHEHTAFIRLVPNGDGCTLIAHYIMREGMTDDQFDSELAWAATDYQAMAAQIEVL